LLIILIYSISKETHLPSLIFILLFGMFIGNLDKLQRFEGIKKLRPDILDKEVRQFKELISEMTFLIRTLFFLLFGYLIETREILNTETIIWAIAITVSIFLIRALFLNLSKMSLRPLFFIAPRGLITILLFLSIPLSRFIDFFNKSLIVQVIVLSSLVMMYGLIRTGGSKDAVNNENSSQT